MYGVLAIINAVGNKEVLFSEDFLNRELRKNHAVDENIKIIFMFSKQPNRESIDESVAYL
jgi:hypothetical protein